jgi:hypothetical protein
MSGNSQFDRPTIEKLVKECGEAAALGRDSLPKLAHVVVMGASVGSLDCVKKHKRVDNGKTTTFDDAEYVFHQYIAAEGRKAVHDRSVTALKVNVSKLRQLLFMGCMTTCDPVRILERTLVILHDMQDKKIKAKSPYAAYVDVARMMLTAIKDRDPTDDEIRFACTTPDRPDPELKKELMKISKKLEGIFTGDNGSKLRDQSNQIEEAIHAVNNRIEEL